MLRTDVVKSGTITSLRALTQEVDLMVSGLSAATAYDVWFVAEDKAIDLMLLPSPNLQKLPTGRGLHSSTFQFNLSRF